MRSKYCPISACMVAPKCAKCRRFKSGSGGSSNRPEMSAANDAQSSATSAHPSGDQRVAEKVRVRVLVRAL